MPIIKSAQKRVRTSKKATVRNAKTKRTMREAIKNLNNTIARGGKPADVSKAHKEAVSTVDIAVKKNVIHKNKAARKKSQLNSVAKAAGAKPTAAAAKKPVTKKAPAKKVTAKKTVAKKAPAKKPVTKKAPAKKPATKKPVAKKTTK